MKMWPKVLRENQLRELSSRRKKKWQKHTHLGGTTSTGRNLKRTMGQRPKWKEIIIAEKHEGGKMRRYGKPKTLKLLDGGKRSKIWKWKEKQSAS